MKNLQLLEKLQQYQDEENKNTQVILKKLILFIYGIESEQTDLYVLAKICAESKDAEDFLIRMINYFDGEPIKLPSKIEYRKCTLIAIAYFFKEIQGYSWIDIYKILNLPEKEKEELSSISIGRKVKKIKSLVMESLHNQIENIDESEFDNLLEKYHQELKTEDK